MYLLGLGLGVRVLVRVWVSVRARVRVTVRVRVRVRVLVRLGLVHDLHPCVIGKRFARLLFVRSVGGVPGPTRV